MKDLVSHPVVPCRGPEVIRVPGDKSISHRAVLIGAITPGETTIENLNFGTAVRELFGPLRQLGCVVDRRDNGLRIDALGAAGAEAEPALDLAGSSAAARMLIGVLAGLNLRALVSGNRSLQARPMGWIVEPLRELGAKIDYEAQAGCLPVRLRGGKLKTRTVRLQVGSAQARSAVLFACVCGQISATIRHDVRSRDHTERLLAYAGIRLDEHATQTTIHGGPLNPIRLLRVPGDPSLAAYPAAAWLSAGAGGRLVIENVCVNPTRTGFFDVMRNAGADIHYEHVTERFGERVGNVVVAGDLSDCGPLVVDSEFTMHAAIDEIPLLCAMAARLPGESVISHAAELAFKETNRLETTREMLRAAGVAVETTGDQIRVRGGRPVCIDTVPSFRDHRIGMAAAVLSAVAGGVARIREGACYATSFPGFVETMNRIGCRFREE